MTTPNSTTDDDSGAANRSKAAPERGKVKADGNPNPSSGVSRSSTRPWSAKLADRFGIEFSEDLKWWWDELCHQPASSAASPPSSSAASPATTRSRVSGLGEFRYPVTPQVLLSTVPDPIWPPLMPPNFLPLIGNGIGDWLCLRVLDPEVAAKKGVTTDICQWYHGGGDWLPWGRRLAEALLFDWTLPNLPQPDRRHAEPAMAGGEALAQENSIRERSADWKNHAWGRWVRESLPAANEIDWAGRGQPRHLAAEMLQRDLCEVPVRCQLVIDALANKATAQINPTVAHELGLAWNDLIRWCFDLRTLPEDVAARLQSTIGIPASHFDPAQQDWEEVARHAAAVCQSHGDLSWGHDLLGYVKLSAGDSEGADTAFSNALRCSVFTDQSVRLRTHWATSSDGVAKFSAKFLEEGSRSDTHSADENPSDEQLGRLPHVISRDRLLPYFGRCDAEGAASVRRRYSQMLIEAARDDGHSAKTRTRLLYAAGWDLGAEPLSRYGDLLEEYLVACGEGGWNSHQQLAQVHRAGLKARYNL